MLRFLPISAKGYHDLAGIKTTYKSPIFANKIAKRNDATIAKFEGNGAIAVAKWNAPEWAGGHALNPFYGLTRNLWDLN